MSKVLWKSFKGAGPVLGPGERGKTLAYIPPAGRSMSCRRSVR